MHKSERSKKSSDNLPATTPTPHPSPRHYAVLFNLVPRVFSLSNMADWALSRESSQTQVLLLLNASCRTRPESSKREDLFFTFISVVTALLQLLFCRLTNCQGESAVQCKGLAFVLLRIGSCFRLACVYRVMDARGKFGEHERSVRVALAQPRATQAS